MEKTVSHFFYKLLKLHEKKVRYQTFRENDVIPDGSDC